MENMIYFDNAATTYPKPEEVYTFMDKYYRELGVNVGRGQYKAASKANKMVEETRKLIQGLFNCPTNKKVVFTPSATEAINIILQGINWKGRENIYITPFEHNAVLKVLHNLEEKYNINIHFLHVEKKFLSYNIEKIKHQFQDTKPDVVIMTHASNVCGLITPIKEITELAKTYDAQVAIDCAQTAGLLDIDIQKVDVDYLVFAGHKTLYGPLGIAGFIVDENTKLKPLLFGGTGNHSANPKLLRKFEVGSINVYAIAGLNAALKWINKIGRENIYEKERNLKTELMKCLESFDNIRVIKPADEQEQIGIASCVFGGDGSDSIGQVLDQYNIAVRAGIHCAPEAHIFLGTFPKGTVRFSLGYFNRYEDIEILKNVLKNILE
jgi:cysteine desulfurase family protein